MLRNNSIHCVSGRSCDWFFDCFGWSYECGRLKSRNFVVHFDSLRILLTTQSWRRRVVRVLIEVIYVIISVNFSNYTILNFLISYKIFIKSMFHYKTSSQNINNKKSCNNYLIYYDRIINIAIWLYCYDHFSYFIEDILWISY